MTQNTYFLRYPFRPLHWITGLETEYEFEIGDLQYSLQAEEPYLVVRVKPFSTEDEAIAYIPYLWGALARISVELRTGFISESQLDPVTYYDDPESAARNLEKSLGISYKGPIDGLVSGQQPSVVAMGKNVRIIKMGNATLLVTYAVANYAPAFINALRQPNLRALHENEKLHTAIELWSDSQRENSLRSKLLTCMTALEVLAKPTMKHITAQQLLDKLDKEIATQIQTFGKDSEEHHALESLQRELVFRREASLRSSIRKLMLDSLPNLPENERIMRARDVVWSYDTRGTLVHDGKVSPSDLSRAHDIAQNALLDVLTNKINLARIQGDEI